MYIYQIFHKILLRWNYLLWTLKPSPPNTTQNYALKSIYAALKSINFTYMDHSWEVQQNLLLVLICPEVDSLVVHLRWIKPEVFGPEPNLGSPPFVQSHSLLCRLKNIVQKIAPSQSMVHIRNFGTGKSSNYICFSALSNKINRRLLLQ
jgi:hypothetical protein